MSTPKNDRAAVRQIVLALVEAGLTVNTVDYGDGETELVHNVDDAIDEVMAVDEVYLILHNSQGHDFWVYFVLGNDPEEVVSDHSLSLGRIIDEVVREW